MYSKIKTILPSDHLIGKASLFLSVMAMFFAVTSGSGGCLYAEECSVGDSESFSNNIRVYSNSTNYHEITGDTNNPNTVDHTLILPNKNGTLLSTAMNFGNNQYLQTNAQGEIISDDLPALDIDDDSKVDVSGITSGKYLQTSATGLNFVDVDINETTFDSSSGTEGQILQINGGNLSFQDISGGGGSFQATASQNIVPGSVGIEANGQVRNIVAQQDAVAQLTLSQASSGSAQADIGWVSSIYNENVDAHVIVYQDYDSANQSTCDTHVYMDVVEENGGTLSNWGRQCISNEWVNHMSNGYPNQYNTVTPQIQEWCYSFERYGLEYDNSVNKYVFIYSGCAGNYSTKSDGQIWVVPASINTNNNTLVIGTESLLHDQNTCNNSGACNYTNNGYYPSEISSNVYAQNTSDANRMWVFWRANNLGNYNGAYRWYKSYQCTFSATPSTNDTCTPYQAFARDLAVGSGSNHLKVNWYDQLSIVVWWDNTAQTFIVLNRTYVSNSTCKIAQVYIAENYNSGGVTYGTAIGFVHGSSGVTDSVSGGTFNSSGSNIFCGGSKARPIFIPEHDSYLWVSSSGSTNTLDHILFHMKGDATSKWGTPIELGVGSLQNLITDEVCMNLAMQVCDNTLYPTRGHIYIDDTVSPYKYYWHNFGMQDQDICLNDYSSTRCAEIFEWSFDSTTGFIDPSTFKHYDYQNPAESYNNNYKKGLGIWKDQSTGVVFTLNAHGNSALDGTSNNKLHAIAFAIPDNIDTLIGYVTQGGNQGATVTVYSIGAVIDGLSGLTIGEEYYVDSSGNIATVGTYKIGRAIGTDKIYITDAR